MNMTWTWFLSSWFVTHEVIEVRSVYHPFIQLSSLFAVLSKQFLLSPMLLAASLCIWFYFLYSQHFFLNAVHVLSNWCFLNLLALSLFVCVCCSALSSQGHHRICPAWIMTGCQVNNQSPYLYCVALTLCSDRESGEGGKKQKRPSLLSKGNAFFFWFYRMYCIFSWFPAALYD